MYNRSADISTSARLAGFVPKIVVLFLRTSSDDCGEPDYLESAFTTSEAVIYRPIIPSHLLFASIMGTDRRDTQFAGNFIEFSRNFCGNDYLSQGEDFDIDPRESLVLDNIHFIQFGLNGGFLPETQGGAVKFKPQVFLQADLSVLFHPRGGHGEWRESWAGKTVRGIFTLVPPRKTKRDIDRILPEISFFGRGIPLKIIMDEVCLLLTSQAVVSTANHDTRSCL